MGISDFLALRLSELYGHITPLSSILVKKEFLLHRPVLIYQPTVNSRARDKCREHCQVRISHREKMRSDEVSTYILVVVVGFRRWREYILAPA